MGIEAEQIRFYGEREQTRTDHQRLIEKYSGFRHPTEEDFGRIRNWLLERDLERMTVRFCFCSFYANAF